MAPSPSSSHACMRASHPAQPLVYMPAGRLFHEKCMHCPHPDNAGPPPPTHHPYPLTPAQQHCCAPSLVTTDAP
eukprot:12247021-Prorocentrum_lima.AAC.1